MSAWIARHRKLLAALAGAAVTVIIQVWGTNTPWVTALILIATAAGVYRAPNDPPQPAPAAAAALPPAPAGRGTAATGTVRVVQPGGHGREAVRAEKRRAGTTGPAPSGTA